MAQDETLNIKVFGSQIVSVGTESELEQQVRQLVRLAARFIRHVQAEGARIPADLQGLLRRHGLAARHLHAMIPLAVDGPMTVNDLAARLGLVPASSSQLVSELAEALLVTREIDPLDRRRAHISLRVHLISKIAALAETRLQPLRSALIQMPTVDRAKFLGGWQILVDSMGADTPAASHQRKRKDDP